MKDLLIIRSVSFQQLDKNLVSILDRFTDHEISLLTHEHGLLLAQKYKAINRVYVYPYKGSFNRKHKVKDFKGKVFDLVIIPVTNRTGAGFFNVLMFSLSIKAKKRIICNVVSDLREISKIDILVMGLKSLLISFLSALFTLIAAIFVMLTLPLKLIRIQSREKE